MTEETSSSDQARGRREIVVVRAGERRLGIFAEEAAGVELGRVRVPLPRAPAAVLGVVSVRGRVLTLLDPLALLGKERERASSPAPPSSILALRGDDQLALAVDSREHVCEISTDEIEPPTGAEANVALGTFQDDGATVLLLDVARLFAVAVEGMEQRRRQRVSDDEK